MRKSAGMVSFGLVCAGMFAGIIFMSMEALILGVVYSGVVFIASYSVLMNYCRKCPHSMNDTCHHVVPGRMAKKLPYKKTGKYTIIELFLVFGSIALVFITPITFIHDKNLLFIPYLVLWVSGALLLRVRVCPKCYNRWCVFNQNRVN